MTSLGAGGLQYMSFERVPAGLAEIEPFLRVANEVEEGRPRVAYLLRYHALEKALQLYPTASGQGVHQFQLALLERLEADNKWTLAERQRSSDARELQSFYQQLYQNYVNILDNSRCRDRALLGRAYSMAHVLFEVLCAVHSTDSSPLSQHAAKEASKKEA